MIESENAEFAFIHDSSEIRYTVTKNCNLTEVGEIFAEQPYAIAVQQGSHLQEEISRKSRINFLSIFHFFHEFELFSSEEFSMIINNMDIL